MVGKDMYVHNVYIGIHYKPNQKIAFDFSRTLITLSSPTR